MCVCVFICMCVGKYAFAWIRLQICYTRVGVNDDYDGMIILARTQTCTLTLETNGLVLVQCSRKRVDRCENVG